MWNGESHSVSRWLDIIQYYMNNAREGLDDINSNLVLHEIRKITALGVACLEEHGVPLRPEWNNCWHLKRTPLADGEVRKLAAAATDSIEPGKGE